MLCIKKCASPREFAETLVTSFDRPVRPNFTDWGTEALKRKAPVGAHGNLGGVEPAAALPLAALAGIPEENTTCWRGERRIGIQKSNLI